MWAMASTRLMGNRTGSCTTPIGASGGTSGNSPTSFKKASGGREHDAFRAVCRCGIGGDLLFLRRMGGGQVLGREAPLYAASLLSQTEATVNTLFLTITQSPSLSGQSAVSSN